MMVCEPRVMVNVYMAVMPLVGIQGGGAHGCGVGIGEVGETPTAENSMTYPGNKLRLRMHNKEFPDSNIFNVISLTNFSNLFEKN